MTCKDVSTPMPIKVEHAEPPHLERMFGHGSAPFSTPPFPFGTGDSEVRYVGGENSSDTNDGRWGSPWATINQAFREIELTPKIRVLYIWQGTYDAPPLETMRDGPLWIWGHATEPGQKVVLKASHSKTKLRIKDDGWVIGDIDFDCTGREGAAIHLDGVSDEERACYNVLTKLRIYGGVNGAAVQVDKATDILIQDSKFFDWKSPTGKRDQDGHAIAILEGASRIRIFCNHSHHNDGDSVQCLHSKEINPGDPYQGHGASHIIIEGNRFHNEAENAVDLKTCQFVTIRDNEFFDFRPGTDDGRASKRSLHGTAIVVQRYAASILIESNEIWCAGQAIAINVLHNAPDSPNNQDEETGVVGKAVMRFNLIRDMYVLEGLIPSDQDGEPPKSEIVSTTGTGIDVSRASQVAIYHNTLYHCGIDIPQHAAPEARQVQDTDDRSLGFAIRLGANEEQAQVEHAVVLNNVISGARFALKISSGKVANLISNYNLFHNAAHNPASLAGKLRIIQADRNYELVEWQTNESQDQCSILGDPAFKNERAHDCDDPRASPGCGAQAFTGPVGQRPFLVSKGSAAHGTGIQITEIDVQIGPNPNLGYIPQAQ